MPHASPAGVYRLSSTATRRSVSGRAAEDVGLWGATSAQVARILTPDNCSIILGPMHPTMPQLSGL